MKLGGPRYSAWSEVNAFVGAPPTNPREHQSKYNKSYSAGYKICHVIKILGGRERSEEREQNGRLSSRPPIHKA